MRILVLGNSDTQGRFVDGLTWSGVVREVLAARLNEPVSLTEAGFSAVSSAGPVFAERRIRELEPDLVILPLGTFAFTVGFSWKRIERLFGKRIAARYRRAEEAFDRRTREPGNEPPRLNRLARKAVRRAIGTQPLLSQKQLTQNYTEIIHAISRIEDVELVLVAYPPEQGKHVTVRKIERRRAEFIAGISAAARQHRYIVVDSAPLFAAASPEAELLTADGFHLQRAGHELLGTAVATAIANRRATAAAP